MRTFRNVSAVRAISPFNNCHSVGSKVHRYKHVNLRQVQGGNVDHVVTNDPKLVFLQLLAYRLGSIFWHNFEI